jgi:hypothetical protein
VDLPDREKMFADDRGGLFSMIEEVDSSELPDQCFSLPKIVTSVAATVYGFTYDNVLYHT